jgi:Ca-activated chloride channel family protein
VSFASPVYLAALALVPLALGAYLLAQRRRRRYAVRFPAVSVLAPLIPAAAAWRRRAPLALFLAALTALALALARPQATVAVPQEQASIVLVTDVSRSMLAEDVDPSRLEAARSAALDFVDKVPDAAKVGVVGFSTDPHTLEAPTDDHAEVRQVIEDLSADGGTATGDALAAALAMLNKQDDGDSSSKRSKRPPAAIVLLSDGETTTGRDPTEVARTARRQHIPIYTVALGTEDATIELPGGTVVPVPPDPETMAQIARLSGGRAFQAEDGGDLADIYKSLGSRVATKKEKREITAAFAAGGGLLLAAAAAFGLRTTARLP